VAQGKMKTMRQVEWLCKRFPAYRKAFIAFGYFVVILLGAVWLLNFPLAALTLFVSNRYPLDYLGITGPSPESPPENIYFVARDLRRLRLGISN